MRYDYLSFGFGFNARVNFGANYSRLTRFSKMDKFEYRAVIKHLVKKGLSPSEIHEDLVKTCGASVPSLRTVRRWIIEFRRGRESLEDDNRCGAPRTVCVPKNISRVSQLVMKDRRLTVRQIAHTLGMSHERVEKILHCELKMTKVSARWVPRLLTQNHKQQRQAMCAGNLKLYLADPDGFHDRFVTQDECWIHHYEPECKVQSMQWKHTGSPTPRKAKLGKSAGKIMASVFWDSDGILMIDYLAKGKTINGIYYADLIEKLRIAIKQKRPGKLSKTVIFHQDNAPSHKSAVAMAAIRKAGFEMLDHPPYSPDLAPSDYHLFPRMKRAISGRRFSTDQEVIEEVEFYFNQQDKAFYMAGIRALKHRWEKCVALKGDYVEK